MEKDKEDRLERAILAILAREPLGAKPSRIVGSLGYDFDANAVRPALERRFNCSWERIEQWRGDWPEERT